MSEIRIAQSADYKSIHALLEQAFENPGEADLVDALRADGDMVLEMIAEIDSRIVGHIAFSSLQAPVWAVALAPLSVAPPYQKRGIGAQLIKHSLARLKQKKWEAVMVLGDPDYYRRFGFDSDMADIFESKYSGEYFMALELVEGCLKDKHGDVSHAPAFGNLS